MLLSDFLPGIIGMLLGPTAGLLSPEGLVYNKQFIKQIVVYKGEQGVPVQTDFGHQEPALSTLDYNGQAFVQDTHVLLDDIDFKVNTLKMTFRVQHPDKQYGLNTYLRIVDYDADERKIRFEVIIDPLVSNGAEFEVTV